MRGRLLANKYRLEDEIGAGAMGRVFRAEQLDLARSVAVKILHPLLARDEGARLRFAREAKVAARLSHPAAVAVLDFGIDEELPFLVMELMEGETLRDHLARERLPRAEALAVTAEVADALVAAHEIRLIHRDIKPENIFLQRGPGATRVRVMDFGLAFLATGEAALGRMTQEGFVGGTPAYMSPEQVHGRGVGPAADIYSLGCMLYELIAGLPPFRGTLAELLTAQAYAPPRPLRLLDLSPPVSPELDRLVMSMLAKSAPLRPSPSAVWHALSELLAEAPSRATAPTYVSERSARSLGRAGRPSSAGSGVRPPDGGAIARGSGHARIALPGAPVGSAPTVEAPSEASRALSGETISSEQMPAQQLRVLALGALDDELELALVSAGCTVEHEAALDVQADVVWAPGVDDRELAALVAKWPTVPIVTDLGVQDLGAAATTATDFPRLLARLRAGATDLVVGDFTPDQLARKLERACRRRRLSGAA